MYPRRQSLIHDDNFLLFNIIYSSPSPAYDIVLTGSDPMPWGEYCDLSFDGSELTDMIVIV